MENLNDILKLNLYTCDIYDITEEKLIFFKNENYYTQNDLYFWIFNEKNKYEKKGIADKIAYCNYLLSYFTLIVMTPFCYEDIAFSFAEKAVLLNSDYKYKEWLLLFAAFEKQYVTFDYAIELAQEVLKENPNSQIANQFI